LKKSWSDVVRKHFEWVPEKGFRRDLPLISTGHVAIRISLVLVVAADSIRQVTTTVHVLAILGNDQAATWLRIGGGATCE
jgi:hypothetical protein